MLNKQGEWNNLNELTAKSQGLKTFNEYLRQVETKSFLKKKRLLYVNKSIGLPESIKALGLRRWEYVLDS